MEFCVVTVLLVAVLGLQDGVVLGNNCLLQTITNVINNNQPSTSCVMNSTEKCAMEDMTFPLANSSALVFPGGTTRCAFDDPVVPKSLPAPIVKKKYFFEVRPAISGAKDKVLLYFQGGGACIDNTTCSYATYCAFPSLPLFTPFVTLYNTSGILNRTIPASDSHVQSPFADWNFIGISYCTGDAHLGNVERDLPPPTILKLVNSQCAKHEPIHQVGYRNAMAAVDWAWANFPKPKALVVGGVSAGSLAAQVYAKAIATKWHVDQNAIEFSILADSYVGVLPNKQDAGRLLKYFGGCVDDLGFSEAMKAKCRDATLTVADITEFNIRALPKAKWLFINSQGDRVQRLYYQLVKGGLLGFPFLQLITPATFYQDMLELLDSYKRLSPLVSTVFIAGEHHGFLVSPLFYSTVDVTGVALPILLSKWLQSDDSSGPEQPQRGLALASSSPEDTAKELRSSSIERSATARERGLIYGN